MQVKKWIPQETAATKPGKKVGALLRRAD